MIIVSDDPSLWPIISSDVVFSYFIVVSFVVVIYDWAITLGQEIELIWRQRWSLMTVIYLSIRYVGMPYLLISILIMTPSISMTDIVSTISNFAMTWITIVVNAMICVIMVARLYAMYQRSRKILIFLVVVGLSATIACVIFAAIGSSYNLSEEAVIAGTHVCLDVEEGVPPLANASWILGTAWEVLALCLAIWIAIKHFRELQRPSEGWIVGDCFRVLVETHIFYFAAFVVVSCFNFGRLSAALSESFAVETSVYPGFLRVSETVQVFVLGPRLIIGVREYYAELLANSDAGTDMNAIAFQERIHISTGSSV